MLCTAYSASSTTAVACLTVAVGVGGFAWAGFGVNHLDIAPQVKNTKIKMKISFIYSFSLISSH